MKQMFPDYDTRSIEAKQALPGDTEIENLKDVYSLARTWQLTAQNRKQLFIGKKTTVHKREGKKTDKKMYCRQKCAAH